MHPVGHVVYERRMTARDPSGTVDAGMLKKAVEGRIQGPGQMTGTYWCPGGCLFHHHSVERLLTARNIMRYCKPPPCDIDGIRQKYYLILI